MTPTISANAPTLASHTIRLTRSLRRACAVGEDSRAQPRLALSRPRARRCRRRARPRSAAAMIRSARAAIGEQQHQRPRAGERPQLLGPAQRRHPAQPADAARRVGDHPEHERDRDDGAAELERQPARRRELAGDGADADEDRDHRTTASARYAEPPTGSPPARRARRSAQPQERLPAAIAASAATNAVASNGARPARARCGRRPPRSAAPGPRPASRTPPRRSPASRRPARRCSRRRSAGRTARRRTAGPPCCWRSCARTEPVGQRRIGVAVADRLDVRDGGEQVAERDRARARIAQRPPRQAIAAVPRLRGPRAGVLRRGATVAMVVVMQEDLLQRRLAAGERRDRMTGQRRDQRTDRPVTSNRSRGRTGRWRRVTPAAAGSSVPDRRT